MYSLTTARSGRKHNALVDAVDILLLLGDIQSIGCEVIRSRDYIAEAMHLFVLQVVGNVVSLPNIGKLVPVAKITRVGINEETLNRFEICLSVEGPIDPSAIVGW